MLQSQHQFSSRLQGPPGIMPHIQTKYILSWTSEVVLMCVHNNAKWLTIPTKKLPQSQIALRLQIKSSNKVTLLQTNPAGYGNHDQLGTVRHHSIYHTLFRLPVAQFLNQIQLKTQGRPSSLPIFASCTYDSFLAANNKINRQSMLLSKSSSLPQLKVNFNKYENFFPKRNSGKELALEEGEPEVVVSEMEKTTDARKKTHLKNLDLIDRKSSIKSKVEAYLTDSRKMGILDHNVDETRNRRSLTKISLESMRPVHTSTEVQKTYVTKLKSELNDYFEKNQRMEHEIKNCQAMTSQVKEKIIFYEQLLSRSWVHRYQLLNQREENIVLIRYESDRLKFMLERLKQINILMKKRVKDTHNKLKSSQNEAKMLNEVEGVKQDELDKKEYLLKHYQQFQVKKSEALGFKTDKAIRNMQENQMAQIMRRHQKSINILDHVDYSNELINQNHQKYLKELLFHKFYSKLLDSRWTKSRTYYQSYEKSEQMIRMHSLDRNCLVQDSYRKSFEIKADLQKTIAEKEKILEEVQAKNKKLQAEWSQICFGQIDQQEKKLNQMKMEFKTGKKLLKDAEQTEDQKFAREAIRRGQEIQRKKNLTIRLRQWIKKQEKQLNIVISKKEPIDQHFLALIKTVFAELKAIQPTYTVKKQSSTKIKEVPKVNKYGNLKKKK